jgi:nucleotide-binding universal stress UspA family protein
MFKKVLLCYDGSDSGRRALKRGAALAISMGAEVHVLSIIREDSVSPAVLASALGHVCLFDEEEEHQRLLDDSIERLSARGVRARGYLVRGNTITEIARQARSLSVDLIVLGNYPSASGRRWWSGADRSNLAEQVRCCILIADAYCGETSS